MFAAVGIYYYLLYALPEYVWYFLYGFLILFFLSRVYTFVYARKRILQLQLPSFYLKHYTIGSIITNIGFILFFFFLLHKYL